MPYSHVLVGAGATGTRVADGGCEPRMPVEKTHREPPCPNGIRRARCVRVRAEDDADRDLP